jgi:nicotinate-nucleotide adenylyltransferase
MRIALFGGTFDPPHRGHLSIAQAAADGFHLDTILFAPAGRQPLKSENHTTPWDDRLAMVTLACTQDPRFQPTTLDAPRPDGLPNYTVDTLAELHLLYPEAMIFSLIGADSFLTLPHWRAPNRLLELAEWIVVSRPGFPVDDSFLTPQQRTRVHLLQTVHEDVAATDLRHRLRTGDPCTDLLPPAVSTYIQTHRLYT